MASWVRARVVSVVELLCDIIEKSVSLYGSRIFVHLILAMKRFAILYTARTLTCRVSLFLFL